MQSKESTVTAYLKSIPAAERKVLMALRKVELIWGGRPIPWARTARGRYGQQHTPVRQLEHRLALAEALRLTAGKGEIEGPARLELVCDYQRNETRILIRPFKAPSEAIIRASRPGGGGTSRRADIDNLEKQVMEAAELAGIVANDCQFVYGEVLKVG